MTVYVERGANGEIKGVYAVSQGEYAEEATDDAAADVVAFRVATEVGRDSTPAALRSRAVLTLLTSADPLAQAVRAAVADLHTRLNDLESARGGRRQAEAEIVTRLVAAIETGAGEP